MIIVSLSPTEIRVDSFVYVFANSKIAQAFHHCVTGNNLAHCEAKFSFKKERYADYVPEIDGDDQDDDYSDEVEESYPRPRRVGPKP